jgi:hypothetical protein
MTLAVAALTIAAGVASAQNLKAEIPFAFRVGKQVMQPGEYQISLLSSNTGSLVLRLANVDVRRTALVIPSYRNDVSKEWASSGLPRMSFTCGEGPCVISRLWTGEGDAFNFFSGRGKDGELRISEIVLRPDRAD